VTINPDAAFSRGDVMRRLADLERQVADLSTARRLEAASIGTGGLSVRGGHVIIQDASGVETMRLSTDGLSLTGLLAVLGSIDVEGGGDITVTDGRLVARDSAGDVFRVDPTIPEIFMRKALISDLVDEVVQELLTSPAGIELAQFVNSQVFHFASDTGAGTVSSSNWTDLTGASAGPTCSGVEISSERRALIIVSALMVNASNERPHMSFAVSGASSFTPGTGFDDQFDLRTRVADQALDARMSAVIPLGPSELTSAGTHTFTAKYRATIGTPSISARTLAVIAY
jgi:hypothetical protein